MNRATVIHRGHVRRQHGVVLLVALIVLVAMTLGALSLVRSIDTGNMVAGNLAFKQSASAAGDAGTEAAVAWLQTIAGTAADQQDLAAQGYYATSQVNLDLTGTSGDADSARVDWDFNSCSGVTASACILPAPPITIGNGYTVTYIVHRLCKTAGSMNLPSNSCADFQPQSAAPPDRDAIGAHNPERQEHAPVPLYRITSRIAGPRNTVSFVETIVHFGDFD